jgi:anthranilate synthase component 1
VSGYLHEKRQPCKWYEILFQQEHLAEHKTQSHAAHRGVRKTNRNFMAAIGFMDFEGNFNHAIMIELSLAKIINCIHKQVPESLPVLMKKVKWRKCIIN